MNHNCDNVGRVVIVGCGDRGMTYGREALSRKTGARGLRALLEKLMLDVMYEAPDRRGHGACVVTADMVRARTTHLEPRKSPAAQPPAPAQASLLA